MTFDGQAFSFQEFGGITRYFSKLLESFATLEGISPDLIIKYSNNAHLADLGTVHTRRFFPSYRFKGRNDIIKLLNREYFRQKFSAESGTQLFHPTYYHPYFLERIGDIPFVLTIHDMAHEHYPKMFSSLDHTSQHKKFLAPRARRIIAVSEHTKKDIVARLGIAETQIDVIPHATTLARPDRNYQGVPLPDEYILYVGKRNSYKNFPIVLNALQRIRSARADCTLVCAGGGKLTKQESEEIERLHLSRAVIQMSADDSLLAFFYSLAGAFVYPSLYEGFGIPVLEAFACGCPALLSNSSSLPEVGGQAAIYFDPGNADSLVSLLNDVLVNRDLAEDLRKKGLERVKLYSWEKTAQQTLESYRKAMQ